jgi:hypothetical protein
MNIVYMLTIYLPLDIFTFVNNFLNCKGLNFIHLAYCLYLTRLISMLMMLNGIPYYYECTVLFIKVFSND